MTTGLSCLLLVAAGWLGCSDPPSGQARSQAAQTASRAAEAGAPVERWRMAIPDVPESLLAELADQPLPPIGVAARVTEQYGEVLQGTTHQGERVFGAAALPGSKASVRGALFRMLDSAGSQDQKQILQAALKLLAYYQDGVDGTVGLDEVAPDGRPYREIVETEVTAVTFEIARRGHGAPD